MRALLLFVLASVALLGCVNTSKPEPPPKTADTHSEDEHTDAAREQGMPKSVTPESNPQIKEIVDKIGAVIYPGATIPDGKSNTKKSNHQTRYELVMHSKDDAQKIGEFYRDKLELTLDKGDAGLTLVGMAKTIPVIIVIYEEDDHQVIQYAGIVMDKDAPKGPAGK